MTDSQPPTRRTYPTLCPYPIGEAPFQACGQPWEALLTHGHQFALVDGIWIHQATETQVEYACAEGHSGDPNLPPAPLTHDVHHLATECVTNMGDMLYDPKDGETNPIPVAIKCIESTLLKMKLGELATVASFKLLIDRLESTVTCIAEALDGTWDGNEEGWRALIQSIEEDIQRIS